MPLQIKPHYLLLTAHVDEATLQAEDVLHKDLFSRLLTFSRRRPDSLQAVDLLPSALLYPSPPEETNAGMCAPAQYHRKTGGDLMSQVAITNNQDEH